MADQKTFKDFISSPILENGSESPSTIYQHKVSRLSAHIVQDLGPPPEYQKARKYYKPWSMRLPALAALFITTCLLFGLVELASKRLPSYNDTNPLDVLGDIVQKRAEEIKDTPRPEGRHFQIRQVQNNTSPDNGAQSTGRPPDSDFRIQPSTSISINVGTPPASDFRINPTNLTPTPQPTTQDQVQSSSPPTTQDNQPTQADTTPDAQVTTPPAQQTESPQASTTQNAPAASTTDKGSATSTNRVTGAASSSGRSSNGASSSGTGRASSTTFATASGTRSSASRSTDGAVTGGNSSAVITDPSQYLFSERDVFVGNFLPTLLAVLFAIPFRMLDSSVRLMEPFYQLHNAVNGLSSADLLGMNYNTMNGLIAFATAVRRSHYRVVISGMISLSFLLLVPLSSEAIYLRIEDCVRTPGGVLCKSQVSVRGVVIRLVQALLAWIAFMLVCLTFFIMREKSGLYGDPTSLTGTTSLVSRTPLDWLLANLPADASKHDINQNLEGVRFHLGNYGEHQEHGIAITTAPVTGETDQFGRSLVRNDEPPPTFYSNISQRASKIWSQFLFISAGCLSITTFSIVLAYWKNSKNNSFEHFMSGQNFGARFMLTLFAFFMRSFWEQTLQKSTIQEVASRLAHKPSLGNETVLVLTDVAPVTTMILAIVRKHFFVTYVALIVILGEILTIAISNVPFRTGTTMKEMKTNVMISLFIMALMIVAFIIVVTRSVIRKRNYKKHNNQEMEILEDLLLQGSLLRTMLLLVGSRWRSDLAGLSVLRGDKRDAVVKMWGRKYGFVVTAVNGYRRMTIDYADSKG